MPALRLEEVVQEIFHFRFRRQQQQSFLRQYGRWRTLLRRRRVRLSLIFSSAFGYNVQVQARFLCGPAGSGKTFRCLEEIRACLQAAAEGPPLVFVSPKQSTFQLERQLLADGTLRGYSRLHILSFERLAEFVFDAFNAAVPKFLGDEGRVMVLRALLLRHENQLKLFRGSSRRTGFAQELSRLFAEFQQHQLSASRLSALTQNQNLRPELRDKLHDLAFLFERYSSWLAENKLRDGNFLLDAATDKLRANAGSRVLEFEALWLDGFAEMTPQEMDLLAAILPFCRRATLAFCVAESGVFEKESSWLSIWNAVGNTFQRCRQRIEQLGCEIKIEPLARDPGNGRFNRSAALGHVEAHWEGGGDGVKFPDGDSRALRIVACSNPDTEAVLAAREILRFVREGNRFRDCAVLVRDLEPFHKTLARTFRRYGIPFFLDRRANVAHHPLAELTRNAPRVAAFDWQHEDWFAALKTGFCPVGESEIDRLENISLARGWRGKKWREPIQIPDDAKLQLELEQLRRKLVPPFEKFNNGLVESKFQPDGKRLAELFRGLWNDLQVEETLETCNTHETNKGRKALSPPIHGTVWEQMNSLLANVELAFANETMNLRDWLTILEAGLANLTVGVIPPTLDQVLVGAIDRARNPDLKFSLILGVNDRIFPADPVASAILTDTDRDELKQVFSLGADLRERLAWERYYGYIAFTRARKQMLVSFSRTDSTGAPLNPSPFVTRLRNLFPELQIESFDGRAPLDEIESVNELVPRLTETQKAGASHAVSDAASELVQSLDALHEPDPAEKLTPEIAGRLYGQTLSTSVSRLEEFAQCPFKFFVRSGLRAGERKMFELDARERGTFQHDVLKQFHEELAAENRRWRDLTPPEARERVGQIARTLAANFRDGLLRDSAQTQFAARAMAESLQNFVEVVVSWMREQYEFDPVAVELDFGEMNSPLPAWTIALDGGQELSLRGRIDRVDLWRELDGEHGLAVVLDYKSSQKKLDPVLVEHGIQLQLPAYLTALLQFKDTRGVFGVEKLVPAGVFYVNLRGQFENGKTRADVLAGGSESRRAAYRHTGRFDVRMLEKLDSAGAADQFHYTLKQDGTLHKRTVEALGQAEFRAWLDRVETQLRRIGNEIYSGAARVDPYRKARETACELCDYSAACRIDPWTHRFRMLSGAKASTE
ncbi:MAG TPA: PD-(D/E)XK nuclease family protein [Candidatus Sulfotelmatobacter sp.]|nr:PD-(D/E)XK nuclease family protein [Candidatus Sulfotelmatobacter sp.]